MTDQSPFYAITGKILGLPKRDCKTALKLFIQSVPLPEEHMRELASTLSLRSDGLYDLLSSHGKCRKAILGKAQELEMAGKIEGAVELLDSIHEYKRAASIAEKHGKYAHAELVLDNETCATFCEERAGKNLPKILNHIESGEFELAMELIFPS